MVKNVAIFASGSGSNAENICKYFKNSSDIAVVLIGTNNENADVVKRAKNLEIPLFVFTKSELENFSELQSVLEKSKVDFIVLAGFLLKIPEKMVEIYPDKIVNIHPALLPKYQLLKRLFCPWRLIVNIKKASVKSGEAILLFIFKMSV